MNFFSANLLDRNFLTVATNRAWIPDSTCLGMNDGRLSLDIVVETFNRDVVSPVQFSKNRFGALHEEAQVA
jgi:hypothetical protein